MKLRKYLISDNRKKIMTTIEKYSMFFTKIQIQKLLVWAALKNGSTTIGILKSELNISKKKLKAVLVSLLDDVKSELSGNTMSFEIHEEVIEILNYTESEYVALKQKLSYRYVLESGVFNLFLYSFEKRSFSVIELTNILFYSESYIYKLLNNLNKFLHDLDLGIKLEKDGMGGLQLLGEESIIRIVHYILIRKVSMARVWLFKTITKEEVEINQEIINYKNYKELSPITKNKLDILYGIYENALRRGHHLGFLDDEVMELGEKISESSNTSLSFKYLKESNTDGKCKFCYDNTHFMFLSTYFLQDIQSKKEKELVGQYISFHLTDNSIVKSCVNLLNEVRRYYKIPETIYYLLIYNLCNRLVVIHYLSLYKIIPLFELKHPVTKMEIYIGDCIDRTFSSYSNYDSFASIKNTFIRVIKGYLQLYTSFKINIYVDFIYKSEYKENIENKILRNYNQELFEVTNDYSEADLIISDTFLYDTNKYFFYFPDIFDKGSWIELGSYLNRIIEIEIET